AAALGDPVVQLLRGRSGQLGLVRVLLALVLVGGARWLPPAGGGAAWPWWVALSLGAGVLLTFSLTTHAATLAEGAALAVALDWLHLLAMVAWLGGLLPLAFAIRAARRDPATALPLAALMPRFSRLAVLSVVALVLTGLYSYLLHIDRLPLLVSTTYGRALLVKLALFGGLLIFGALNLLVFSPRLRAGRGRSVLVFGRTVRVELLLGALVLLATGVMISIPPSKTAWETRQQLGVLQEARVGQVTLTLRIAPGQVGDNEFAVDVTDPRPGGASTPGQVLLRFHMADMDMGNFQVETKPSDGQRYTARGSYLAMAGTWQVEALLQRPGFDDVRHTFTITPGQTTESAGLSVSRILANTLSPLAGIGVMGIVFAALAFLRRAGLRHPRARQRAAVVGVAFFLVGSVASAGALASAYRAAQPNPVPATEESLARGREIYRQHCASCHGISGRGDGLAGRLLRPRPADFRVHLAAGHSDAQLYDWVAHGVPGTGMPAWEGQLTEQQIWDVINYIRTFASP
ncbi:MAG: CopD family protein, partial [Chloroflexota bacterium]|nr:CopD family protein [Chloroflexota bacterium]